MNFLEKKWEIYRWDMGSFKKLPNTCNVYAIEVNSPLLEQSVVVYIGYTDDLRSRMCTHLKLKELKYSNAGYSINIYYRNFGALSNGYKEKKLIKKYRPPFDYSIYRKKSEKVLGRYLLWKSIGVNKVVKDKKGLEELYTVDEYIEQAKVI